MYFLLQLLWSFHTELQLKFVVRTSYWTASRTACLDIGARPTGRETSQTAVQWQWWVKPSFFFLTSSQTTLQSSCFKLHLYFNSQPFKKKERDFDYLIFTFKSSLWSPYSLKNLTVSAIWWRERALAQLSCFCSVAVSRFRGCVCWTIVLNLAT